MRQPLTLLLLLLLPHLLLFLFFSLPLCLLSEKKNRVKRDCVRNRAESVARNVHTSRIIQAYSTQTRSFHPRCCYKTCNESLARKGPAHFPLCFSTRFLSFSLFFFNVEQSQHKLFDGIKYRLSSPYNYFYLSLIYYPER